MALYEAAQDVKLDFGFDKKRRWKKNNIKQCRYEIFGKKTKTPIRYTTLQHSWLPYNLRNAIYILLPVLFDIYRLSLFTDTHLFIARSMGDEAYARTNI